VDIANYAAIRLEIITKSQFDEYAKKVPTVLAGWTFKQ
jgi:hypothetical protein